MTGLTTPLATSGASYLASRQTSTNSRGRGYVNGILGKEIHPQPVERFFWDFIPFKTEEKAVWRKGHSPNHELFHRYPAKFFEIATYYQIVSQIRYPMRCVQNQDYGYLDNVWAEHESAMTGDSTGRITWKAMIEAAKEDPQIADRVELYKFRVPEEFYNWKRDPDGLNNLAEDPEHADELKKFRNKMLEMMQRYDDPAYEAYRDRHKQGVLNAFMEAQREKAKRTKPVERF